MLHDRIWNKTKYVEYDYLIQQEISLPYTVGLQYVSRLLNHENKVTKINFAPLVARNKPHSLNSRFRKAFLGKLCNIVSVGKIETNDDMELVLDKMKHGNILMVENLCAWGVTPLQLQQLLLNPKLETLTFSYETFYHDPTKIHTPSFALTKEIITFLPTSNIVDFSISLPSLEVMDAIMISNITTFKVILPRDYSESVEFCSKLAQSKITHLTVLSDSDIGTWTIMLPFHKLTHLTFDSTISTRQNYVNGLLSNIFDMKSSVVWLQIGNYSMHDFNNELEECILNPHSNVKTLKYNPVTVEYKMFGRSPCRLQKCTLYGNPRVANLNIEMSIKSRMYIDGMLVLMSSRIIKRISGKSSTRNIPLELYHVVCKMFQKSQL